MFKSGFRNKGVVLLVVLFSLLIVAILTSVILQIILNQSQLTLNQLTRIQAYYATLAGMNLALDRLMATSGTWTTGTYFICCGITCIANNTVNDCNIPWPVQITIGNPGTPLLGDPSYVGRQINITTTYTPPSS